MNLPRVNSYGQYTGNNYGVHTLVTETKGLTVYFSYQTPVAFYHSSTGLVVRENDWGPTTGKHLNWIDGGDKENRISGKEFEKQLSEVQEKI